MKFPAMNARVLLLVASGLSIASGCGDKQEEAQSGEAEDLTIVVEADKTRILQEEQTLQQKKESFEKERERLLKERTDVEQRLATLSKKDKRQRDELEAQQQKLADDEKRIRDRAKAFETDRDKLDNEKTKLLERIAKMTATKGGLTIEQREQVIAQREKDLAQREAKLAEREAKVSARESEAGKRLQEVTRTLSELASQGGLSKTVVVQSSGGSSAGASSATKASVQKLQKQVRARMDAKGILLDDLPPAARTLWQGANKAADDKDYASAYESLSELESAVESIAVNGEFVKAKMGRINRDVEKKSPDEQSRKQIQALLNDVGEAMNDGRYDRANKKINQIVALLQK